MKRSEADSVRRGENDFRRGPIRAIWLATAVLVAANAVATYPAASATTATIAVHLQDATDDPSMAGMKLAADRDSVPAGPVSFVVTNDSKSVVHELLVMKVADPKATLPYDDKSRKIVEGKVTKVVDSDDINPGAKKTITASLRPGDYILVCNQPGHFLAGMKTPLTVTK